MQENISAENEYLPLQTGNVWYYDIANSDNNPYIKKEVKDIIIIDSRAYFIVQDKYIYTHQEVIFNTDTLYKDGKGRIWQSRNDADFLLYDFTLDEGETYSFPGNSAISDEKYIVTVKKFAEIEINEQKYNDCIELFFNIPEWRDEERWLIFSKSIGIIKEIRGEGPTIELSSFSF